MHVDGYSLGLRYDDGQWYEEARWAVAAQGSNPLKCFLERRLSSAMHQPKPNLNQRADVQLNIECLCSCACVFARSWWSPVFAPHIIMRPADVEQWHRPADEGFISLLLNTKFGVEVEKDFIQVDRKKPMSCNIVPPPKASEMDRTVRACTVRYRAS